MDWVPGRTWGWLGPSGSLCNELFFFYRSLCNELFITGTYLNPKPKTENLKTLGVHSLAI
jgi:hypothetical protein